jgi:hypothetical protein
VTEYEEAYRFGSGSAWVQFKPWIAVVEKTARFSVRIPLGGESGLARREFYARCLEHPAHAAFELPFREFSQWCARTTARRDGRDRQIILGGIYDRFSLRRAARWLRYTAPDDVVRLKSVPAWEKPMPWEYALVAQHSVWTVMLMPCRAGTAHGDDPLPWGGERDDEGG